MSIEGYQGCLTHPFFKFRTSGGPTASSSRPPLWSRASNFFLSISCKSLSLQVPLRPRHHCHLQDQGTAFPITSAFLLDPSHLPSSLAIIVSARITLGTELRLQLGLPPRLLSLSLFLLHKFSLDVPICWPAYKLLRWLEALSSPCLLDVIYTPSSILRVDPHHHPPPPPPPPTPAV